MNDTSDIPAITVSDLILAHRHAVWTDEATYLSGGTSKNEAASAVTRIAEISIFRDLVKAPCHSDEDVQAKLDYLLNGTVGLFEQIAGLLTVEDYCQGDDLVLDLLKSLAQVRSARPHAYAPDAHEGED